MALAVLVVATAPARAAAAAAAVRARAEAEAKAEAMALVAGRLEDGVAQAPVGTRVQLAGATARPVVAVLTRAATPSRTARSQPLLNSCPRS